MIRTKLLAALLVGALLSLFAVSAASAQDCGYGGPGCTTTTQPPTEATTTTTTADIPTITVVRGETVDVSGADCAPGADVTVTWDDGTVLGTFQADDNGDFVATITIPSNASLGEHLITATCGDVQQFVKAEVMASGTTTPGVNDGGLARTGSSNTGPLVGIGAAALVLGAAFVYGARRPRTAE